MQKDRNRYYKRKESCVRFQYVSQHLCFSNDHMLHCYKITLCLLFNSNLNCSSNILLTDTHFYSVCIIKTTLILLVLSDSASTLAELLDNIMHYQPAVFSISVYLWWAQFWSLGRQTGTDSCTTDYDEYDQSSQYQNIMNIKRGEYFWGWILHRSQFQL